MPVVVPRLNDVGLTYVSILAVEILHDSQLPRKGLELFDKLSNGHGQYPAQPCPFPS